MKFGRFEKFTSYFTKAPQTKIRRCSLCLKEHFLTFPNNFPHRSFGASQSKYPGTMLDLITRVHLLIIGRLCLPHLP